MLDNLQKAFDENMDWLSEQPEAEIRRMFTNLRIPPNVDFSWEISGTDYIVTSHFDKSSGSDIFRQLLRLLDNEVRE
jgi:hypothetical protein